VVRDVAREGEVRIYLDGRDVTAAPRYQRLPVATEDHRIGLIVGASAPWFVGREKTPFRGDIQRVTVYRGLPPEFAASADAAATKPATAPPPEPIAMISPMAAESTTPLALAPATTVVLVPRKMPFQSEVTAATLLRDYLRWAARRETGFAVVRNGKIPPTATAVLAVGRTRFVLPEEQASLAIGGTLLRRKQNVVVICGRLPADTLMAARSFLDLYAGVRFYMPTDRFTSRPAAGIAPLGAIDRVVTPHVQSTFASGFHSVQKAESQWARRNGVERRNGGSHQHTFFTLFRAEKFRTKYPGIWAEYNGKREPLQSQHTRRQVCFSAPSLVDASVEAAHDYFAANPTHAYIAFSVMDNHDFCTCTRCTSLRAAHGEVETRVRHGRELRWDFKGNGYIYWTYMNAVAARLAEDLPEKSVVGIAYSDVRKPPPFDLHPNIVVWRVWKMSDILIDKRFEKQPADNLPPNTLMAHEWNRRSSAAGHHDWAHGRGFFIPRVYTRLMQRSLREMRDLGAPIRYVHMEAYPSWGMSGPFYYIAARLWEDPDSDIDAMLKTFCEDMFGAAAPAMQRYFNGLEALFIALNAQQERKLNRYKEQFMTDDVSRPLIAACRGHLDAARAVAADDAEASDRIDLFDRCYTLAEKLFAAHAGGRNEDTAAEILTYAAAHIAPDPMTVYRSKTDDVMERLVKALRMAGVTRKPSVQRRGGPQ
jgi:hypothetical protein